MAQKSQEIKAIFAEAIQKTTSEELSLYLNEVCGSDLHLRTEVESLLTSHRDAGKFLQGLLGEYDTKQSSLLTEQAGATIDRYKLLEKIGEGGMAAVYMAEQQRPIRRKVALKIIKLGMDTKSVIARFEAERQALAMMDHSNIAKVLDAGATETGRPYFVMDLVPGLPITEYCDKNRLSIKERLRLFITVCDAVQHAHQKGIIHRDIKPSNIMVTMHNSKPVPKVIDFGIAKATNQRLTEKTLFTRYAHIIGTPAYMSPEQAELSDLDVDTRTDVYSLGVLLYELLTGTTPFSEEKLREAGYLQMQKIICEEEPTKPSTKLSTLGEELTDVAKWHNSSPELLPKLIRGDLDWIVLKSLDKDRNHRYDTASALAADVQRHLKHEPVQARAPKTLYRLKKFARRHRSQTITAAAIAVLIIGMIYILSMWNQNRLQLKEAKSITDMSKLSQAHESFSKGDLVTAATTVKSILNSKYVGSEARLLYAGILVEGQQPEEATGYLEDLLDENPEIAGASYLLLARILWEGESRESEKVKQIDAYRQKAEELLPETAEAYFLRAMTTLTIKAKLELLDKALRIDNRHYESYRLRAFTYYASKKYDKMKDDALIMQVLRQNDPMGYSLCAIALQKLGNYEDAIINYDNAIGLTSLTDSQIIELYAQRSEIHLLMGEYEHAIADAKEGLAFFPEGTTLNFRIFCALVAQGNYGQASNLYHRITDSDLVSKRKFRDWSMKYVFDTLEAGDPWYPQDSKPEGVAFLPMLEAEETYHHLSIKKAKRLITDGFNACWSPDGTKMVFSLGIPGNSGIAIFNPTSQKIDLLIAPGKDPKWSPDGKYIAFVRDCQILPLSELVTAEQSSEYRSYRGEEIWIMNADGTEPRRLAHGSWPSWGQDSKHVYYQWRGHKGFYSISVEDEDSEPQLILPSNRDHGSVSPHETQMAGATVGELVIIDLSSHSLVAVWRGPPLMWGGNWHPKDHEFSMGGYSFTENRTGLWIYDLENREAQKVLSGQITSASWAPDGKELAFTLGAPYHEIWFADLDPNISSIESLGGGRTLEEHYQEMVDHYTRLIEADPNDAENYRLRAQYYDFLHDEEKALTDIHHYEAALNSMEVTSVHDRWIRDLLVGLLHNVPEKLGSPLNSQSSEFSMSLSTDGLTLYFNSDRPGGYGSDDLWKSTRLTTEDNWGEPENLETINSKFIDSAPSISVDGLSLYFRSDRPGGLGGFDLWVSTRAAVSDLWGTPENLGPTVNSSADDSFPSISSDGISLFFDSSRIGGHGHYDLWVTTRKSKDDTWEDPVNLGPTVNSSGLDGGPCISADGRTLFFFSVRPGSYGWLDIYVTGRETTSSPWSEPVNLGPLVNSRYGDFTPSISADGSTLFFASNQPGWDLWQVSINPISVSFQQDNDDSNRLTIKSENGKEVVPETNP
jgi:serine/threonine protein kinase/Tol biopolymer transport system component